jgi:UDP-N-acetylmuramoyl-tripeptide--D-alanyl-D-alanine ligase
VNGWTAQQIAAASGAELHAAGDAPTGSAVAGNAAAGGAVARRVAARDAAGPAGVSIDSRAPVAGELFVGLAGERTEGGRFAADALSAGAWGVLVSPEHAARAQAAARGQAVLVHEDPLHALQALARAWRRELVAAGARVVAVTGSAGKTSTKDILAALLGAHLRTVATPANLNTEIGLPLALLGAPAGTECLILEMAMRGEGQIAELTAIAEPDVGVIVNVGAAHLELLGSLEAIAAAKSELIAGLAPGACAVIPAAERLLVPHLREDVRTITFGGPGADVSLRSHDADGKVTIDAGDPEPVELWPSFSQAHNLTNLLAAVAVARALSVVPHGRLDVRFSAGRGQRLELPGDVVVIDDCYNANPMSMHAAIEELAATPARRRVAVLGDMLELGEEAPALHREIGAFATSHEVGLLVTVGPLAAEMSRGYAGSSRALADATAAAELLPDLLEPGDVVLVKGSRGVGLERVVEAVAAGHGRR